MKNVKVKLFIILFIAVITFLIYYQATLIAGSQYPIPSYIAYPDLSILLLMIILVAGADKLAYLKKKIGCIKPIDYIIFKPITLLIIVLAAQAFDLSTTFYGIVSGKAVESNPHVDTLIKTGNIPIWIGEQLSHIFLVGLISIFFNSTRIRIATTTYLLVVFSIGLIAGISNSLIILNSY